MFTVFNTESLYVGTDLKRFNGIRNILDANKVKYRYKTRNRLDGWSTRGTVRGNMGSAGNMHELMYEYEILVLRRDYETAKRLIGQ